MTKLCIKPGALDKFMHQNKAEYTGAFYDGCLLDNFMLACRRGVACVYEHYVNEGSSDYYIEFAKYGTSDADMITAKFYSAEDAALTE